MWNQLKIACGGTSATRLPALTLKFEQYVMDSKHSMAEHLRTMFALICDLKAARNNLSDEQHITAMIRSLLEPTSGQMQLVLTHSENIKIFADISRHLKLEVERMGAHQNTLLVAQSGQRKAFRPKRKGQERNAKGAGNIGPKEGKIANHQKGKCAKKDKAEIKCDNCGKKGYFACECIKPKKVSIFNNSAITYVCTHIFVAHTIPGWIVDSGATKHISKDRVVCVDYKKNQQAHSTLFWVMELKKKSKELEPTSSNCVWDVRYFFMMCFMHLVSNVIYFQYLL